VARASGFDGKIKGVYIITFRDRSVYIGQSCDINGRMKGHAADPFKTGLGKAKIEIIFEESEDQRKIIELFLLRAYAESGKRLRNYSFSAVKGKPKNDQYDLVDCTKIIRPLIKSYAPKEYLVVKPFKFRKRNAS
jgi:hypothetical protein